MKFKSKLFDKFELKNSELKEVLGGAYTSADTDTSTAGGSKYDISYETCNDGVGETDVTVTSIAGDTKDKPISPSGNIA